MADTLPASVVVVQIELGFGLGLRLARLWIWIWICSHIITEKNPGVAVLHFRSALDLETL